MVWPPTVVVGGAPQLVRLLENSTDHQISETGFYLKLKTTVFNIVYRRLVDLIPGPYKFTMEQILTNSKNRHYLEKYKHIRKKPC